MWPLSKIYLVAMFFRETTIGVDWAGVNASQYNTAQSENFVYRVILSSGQEHEVINTNYIIHKIILNATNRFVMLPAMTIYNIAMHPHLVLLNSLTMKTWG